MGELITSSPVTLKWLNEIRSEIEQINKWLEYNATKYWATFKSLKTGRNIAYLQPQKTQIRLFLRLEPSSDSSLLPAPSSGSWQKNYPSLFLIKDATMTKKASILIIKSCEYDEGLP